MKFNKLLIITVLLLTVFSLTACKGDEKPVISNENSKPSFSQPENSAPEKDENKNETSSTPTTSKPVVQEPVVETPKKTAKELIVGKWKAVVDITEYLTEMGYDIEGTVKITINSEFKADGTFTETADELIFKTALQNAFGDEYKDKYYDTHKNDFNNSGNYKFDGDIFSMQFGSAPDFAVVEYNFANDNKLSIISTSDEISYTRI